MRAVKIAAVVGILTWPLDALAHHDIGGIIRLCQVDGWTCADELAGLLGGATGWTVGAAFVLLLACSARNLLVMHRL